jgi:hypothetical protein
MSKIDIALENQGFEPEDNEHTASTSISNWVWRLEQEAAAVSIIHCYPIVIFLYFC